MAAARPVSPVSAFRPGRTTPNSAKRRCSRASLGRRPARRIRRLTCARRTQHDEQRLRLGQPHAAELVEPVHDWRIPTEEHGGIDLFERFPTTIWSPIHVVGRRPYERMRADAGPADGVSVTGTSHRWRTSPVVRRPRRSRSCHSRRTGRTAATPTSSHHRPTARGGRTKSVCSDSPRRGIRSCTHGTLPNCLTGGRPRLHIWRLPAAVCLSIALQVGGPLRDRYRGKSQSPAQAPGPPASVSGPTPRESRDLND